MLVSVRCIKLTKMSIGCMWHSRESDGRASKVRDALVASASQGGRCYLYNFHTSMWQICVELVSTSPKINVHRHTHEIKLCMKLNTGVVLKKILPQDEL